MNTTPLFSGESWQLAFLTIKCHWPWVEQGSPGLTALSLTPVNPLLGWPSNWVNDQNWDFWQEGVWSMRVIAGFPGMEIISASYFIFTGIAKTTVAWHLWPMPYFFSYNNPSSYSPCLFSLINLCAKHRWCYPRWVKNQQELPAVGTEILSAGGCGSQGACTSIPMPMKCLAQVQGAQEVLLSGGGQSDVNKALKPCCVVMTQESHAIPRSC